MAKVNVEKEIGYAELKLSSIDKKICYIEKGINKFKDYMSKLIRSGTVDNDKLSEFLHKEYNLYCQYFAEVFLGSDVPCPLPVVLIVPCLC